jgi:tetratricopeptide (TPR) repeat protein
MPNKPFDLDNNANAKLYVSEQVLARLSTGEFRPIRERSNNFHLDDRRDRLSPLAISKRAIRYEPHVFFNRGPLVYEVAKCLNDPQERVLMIGGTSGIGKTSFVRGVIELMGGTPAQLLWFDVTPMTDVDQITRFMVEYLFYIYQSARPDIHIDESISPIESLRYLIQQSPDQRILLVLDNAELLVTPDEHFRSKDFREMVQFLLGFPNIKLLLSGTRLPLKDLKSASRHWWLSPLTDEQLLKVVHMTLNQAGPEKKTDKPLVPLDTLRRVVPLFRGTPEYAWVWMRLLKLLPSQRSQKVLNLTASDTEHIDSMLLQIALENLTESQFAVAELLSLIRHGVTPTIMREVLSYCLPQLPMEKLNNIDQIVLGTLLKKVYPPQSVLTWLHKREQLAAEGVEHASGNNSVEPSYALVDVFADRIRERLSLETKAQLHQRLSSMYQDEKRKPVLERILPVKTSYLMNEVEYHVQLSKLQQRFSNNPIFQRSRREARPLVSAIEDSINALEDPKHMDFDEHGNVGFDDIPIYSTDQLQSKVTVLRTSSTSAKAPPLPPENLVVTGDYSATAARASGSSMPMPSISADFSVFADPSHDASGISDSAFAEDASSLKEAPDGKLRVSKASSAMPMTVLDEHIALARFYHFDGAYKEAQHHWQLALGLLQKGTESASLVGADVQAEIYYALGSLYLLGKHNAHALYCFRRAMNLLPESDPRLGHCHFRLGTLFDEAGKLPKAMKHYVQSYKIHTKYGNTDTCATVLYNMAQIQAERGELDQAIRLLDDSIRLDFKGGNTQNAVKSLLALAELYQQTKNLGKLLETLETAKRHSQQSPKLKAWIQQRLQQTQQRVDAVT